MKILIIERTIRKSDAFNIRAGTVEGELLGNCFSGEGRWKSRWPDRRAGKRGLRGKRGTEEVFRKGGVSVKNQREAPPNGGFGHGAGNRGRIHEKSPSARK